MPSGQADQVGHHQIPAQQAHSSQSVGLSACHQAKWARPRDHAHHLIRSSTKVRIAVNLSARAITPRDQAARAFIHRDSCLSRSACRHAIRPAGHLSACHQAKWARSRWDRAHHMTLLNTGSLVNLSARHQATIKWAKHPPRFLLNKGTYRGRCRQAIRSSGPSRRRSSRSACRHAIRPSGPSRRPPRFLRIAVGLSACHQASGPPGMPPG